MKKDSGSLKMGAERTRSGFNARCLWSWLLADEDEQSGQPEASDVRRALLQLPRWSLPFSGIHSRRLTIGRIFRFCLISAFASGTVSC